MCLGAIISGLGPIIVLKAKELDQPETDFGIVFTMRGLGYLLGSYFSGKTEGLIDSHTSLALGCCGLGIFAILSLKFDSIFLLSLAFFFMGSGCGNLDVMTNTLIVQVNREYVSPWMQGLHFAFGVGASLSPVFIAWIEGTTFLIFGIISIVIGLGTLTIKSPEVRYKEVDVRILKKKINLLHDEDVQQAIENHEKHDFELSETPFQLIFLVSAFLFVYVGVEVGYGGWISSYCSLTELMGKEEAMLGSSVFWTTITIGRLLGIPAGYYFTTIQQIKILLWLNLGFSVGFYILALNEMTIHMVYTGSLVFGFCLSTLYPLAISVPQ